MKYDKAKNGWNRDWETDNIPEDMSNVHMETCPTCDMPVGECGHLKLLTFEEEATLFVAKVLTFSRSNPPTADASRLTKELVQLLVAISEGQHPRVLTAEDIERIGKNATKNGSNISHPQRY